MNERLEPSLEPSEEVKGPITFENAIPLFPEEEQSLAEYYSGIRQRYMEIAKRDIINGDLDTYDILVNYCKQNGSKTENCRLHHLFAGSSMSGEKWFRLPLDTPGDDWKEFIENSIVPLIEKSAA